MGEEESLLYNYKFKKLNILEGEREGEKERGRGEREGGRGREEKIKI